MPGSLLGKFVKKDTGGVDIEEFLNTLSTKREEDVYANADALVMPIDVTGDADAQQAIEELQKGNLVLLNIRDLQARNPIKLKAAISKIKDAVSSFDGDVARLTEDLVLVTPARVKIVKRR